MSVAASAAALQSPKSTDCRHSREPFHCLFRMIATRRDVSPIAKLTHQALVSMRRTGKEWTQAEIGDEVGLSRHQVWKGLAELISAKWIRSTRRGLGKPNTYELLVIDPADLDGKAPKSSGFRPARHQDAGQSGSASRRASQPKNPAKEQKETGVPGTYAKTRQPGMVLTDRGLRYVGPS